MNELWFYAWMSRWPRLNYRAKIMVMAFLGTHIPLIALIAFFAITRADSWHEVVGTVATALVATLVGTGLTLFVLNHLLRPVLATSRTLSAYRERRELVDLPTHFTDEAGTLMADASNALRELDAVLDDLTYRDATTRLPNRDRFLQLLARRIGEGGAFGVVALRVANYNALATTFDASQADGFARVLSDRLAERLGPAVGLARVSPDVFAFIARPGPDDSWHAATDLAHQLRLLAAAPIHVDGVDIRPSVQGGMARFPEDGEGADALLDNAVSAAALATPSTPVALHAPEARRAARERLRLEQELRQALEDDQFVLHYQPVVDLSVGRVVGAEALIRWQHPVRGLVPPGQFIPVAESTGLIDPMGLWVMQQACRQARDWKAEGVGHLKVAVNLSARQFLDPNLATLVREAIEGSGVDADQLEIELTETAAMVDHEHTRKMFTALRDLGVSIAIDDFGTGYAGMSYLRKLPFDKLKIDREFVSNVHRARDSQAICSALVELSNGLGLQVLAEGVEQEDEVRHLFARGCNLFQGFYFSRPVDKDVFASAARDLAVPATAMRLARTRNEWRAALAG